MDNSLIVIFVSMVAAVVAVHWVYPMILKIAKERNLTDKPDERKLQKAPVPVLGGVAVTFGIFVGIQAGLVFSMVMGLSYSLPTFSIMASILIMLYVGAIDDTIGLSPRTRFIYEIVVVLGLIYGTDACIDSMHGVLGIGSFSWWVAVPFTVFACVGVINAVNMIDGVNGLSSSLCILNNMLFGIVFAKSGMLTVAVVNFTTAAALLPFLLHNVVGMRSKMFIGDAGTMVMGIIMCYDVIYLLHDGMNVAWMEYTSQGMSLVAVALAIVAVPVADTLRVMTMRMWHHQSPFQADKTHLHHVLMEYSMSHALTTLVEVGISLLIFVAWMVSYLLGASINVQFFTVMGMTMLLVWGSYVYLVHKRKVRTGLAWRLRKLFASLRQGESEWWKSLQEWVDRVGERKDDNE